MSEQSIETEGTKGGTVSCDEGCGAPDNPQTLEDYKAAYEHWRFHGYLFGCSHGD